MGERLREVLRSGEWIKKFQFGDRFDYEISLSDLLFKYYGITEDWRKEAHLMFADATKRESQLCENALIQEQQKQEKDQSFFCDDDESSDGDDESSDGDSSDYDYDYADFSQEYHDIFNHRLSLFHDEELSPDKDWNTFLMGKQLLLKAYQELNVYDKELKNSESGKEASEVLFKTFADFPRAIMYMATISHSLY